MLLYKAVALYPWYRGTDVIMDYSKNSHAIQSAPVYMRRQQAHGSLTHRTMVFQPPHYT